MHRNDSCEEVIRAVWWECVVYNLLFLEPTMYHVQLIESAL